ncbi:dihydrofolate reductase family protein [Leifsonia sp. L25]|uniref:dihydrofolate reductase family protein n=1 Tax=Actinomycetes TaxID=1760 RepID=UPI003D68215B
MSEATIDRIFPLPPEEGIGDTRIAELYSDGAGNPWLRVNFVSSIDGAATRQGLSGGLSDDADHRVFDILRRLCDVVLVGAGTVRAEGYGPMRVDEASQRARRDAGMTAHPVFAIVSASLDLDPASPIFRGRRSGRSSSRQSCPGRTRGRRSPRSRMSWSAARSAWSPACSWQASSSAA